LRAAGGEGGGRLSGSFIGAPIKSKSSVEGRKR
jgi:hypothetical protein